VAKYSEGYWIVAKRKADINHIRKVGQNFVLVLVV